MDLIYLNMNILAWIYTEIYWLYIYFYLLYIYTLAFNYSKISVRIGQRKMSSSFTPEPRRMSGVQGGLGEHKRDILKLREARNGNAGPKLQTWLVAPWSAGSEWLDSEERFSWSWHSKVP